MRLYKKVTFLLLFVGLIQLLILSGFILLHVESTLRSTIHKGYISLAMEVGKEVNRLVYEAYQNILLLAENPIITSSEATREDQEKELVKTQKFHRIFRDITLLDTEGHIRASVYHSFRGSWRSTYWFQSAIQGKPVLSDVHAVLHPFEIVMTAFAPFKDKEGQIAGILVGQLDMEKIWGITNNVSVGRHGEVLLVDHKGIIISGSHPEKLLERIQYEEIYRAATRKMMEITELKDENGQKLAICIPIPGNHPYLWNVVILQPKKVAYAPLYQLRFGLFLSLLACILAVIVLSPMISRWVTKRIHRLLEATRSLGEGNVSIQVDDLGRDEIGELGKAFNRASQELSISQKKIMEYSEHLETMVEKRTSELKKTQAELIETAHLAGMAEVATGVLHNIGNAINSVNVRMRFIKDAFESCKLKRIIDAVKMLESHAGHMDQYLNEDPRGEKILPYMKLSLHKMIDQQKVAQSDIRFLNSQIKHVCDIITIQQSYAKGDIGICEVLQINEILIDAIRMQGDLLEKNEIHIKTDFSYFEPMLLNRQQIIQIFINLIKNAVQSIVSAASDQKMILISTRVVNENGHKNPMLEVAVRDTGEGFSPGIKKKIFNYGFTTKGTEGKGFGLHFCANYLHSIHGSIRAESEGPGKGATFFVRVPIKKAGARKKETVKHAQDLQSQDIGDG